MNTIPTAIGLETGAGRTEAHNGLQEWLANNGLQPYLPQLAERAARQSIQPPDLGTD